MKTQPAWLDKNLFPFASHWISVDGNELHYVDEGKGDILLFVHGTPEWSFGFRDLIKSLRKNFRCIAIDHLGFGLSDKPANGTYSCEAHSLRLTRFVDRMELKNITIVANDFGGGISMGYAINHANNIKQIVLFNTWMWSLKDDKHYSGPARVINTWLGRFLYLKLNFPVNNIMPAAFGDKKKLTRHIHDHYRKPVPDPESRVALYAIAKELMNASDWWQSLWEKRESLRDKPMIIFWGLKDKFVPSYELEKWKSGFPQARVITFEDAGHFVQEEKPEEMIEEIERLTTLSNKSSKVDNRLLTPIRSASSGQAP